MTTTTELERSLHAYADHLTHADPDALVAGAEQKVRHRRRTRAALATSSAAILTAATLAGALALRSPAVDGQIADTPTPTTSLPPLPAAVKARASQLKVDEFGPGMRLAAVQEVVLQPKSVTPIRVPDSVRGKRISVVGLCRPADGKPFTTQDEVRGFEPGPDIGRGSIRCATPERPRFPTHLPAAIETRPSIDVTNQSPRVMSVTIFYATELSWERFPVGQVPAAQLGMDLSSAPDGRTLTTINSGADPKAPVTGTVRVPGSAAQPGLPPPMLQFHLRTGPGRFRILVNGQRLECGAPFGGAAVCRDGLVTVWGSTSDQFVTVASRTDIRPGTHLTIRVEPVDARGQWTLRVGRL